MFKDTFANATSNNLNQMDVFSIISKKNPNLKPILLQVCFQL